MEIFSLFEENRTSLENHKLLYPKDFLWLKEVLRYDNFSKTSFDKIYDLSPNKAYKAILFLVIEQFSTGENPYITIEYVSINPENQREVISDVYRASNADKNQIRSSIFQIINDSINMYGSTKLSVIDSLESTDQQQIISDEKVYIMNFESYSKNDLNDVVSKIKKFGKVNVIKNTNTMYNLKVTTDLSEEEFADKLYENKLTYRVRKDGLFLIKEETGV